MGLIFSRLQAPAAPPSAAAANTSETAPVVAPPPPPPPPTTDADRAAELPRVDARNAYRNQQCRSARAGLRMLGFPKAATQWVQGGHAIPEMAYDAQEVTVAHKTPPAVEQALVDKGHRVTRQAAETKTPEPTPEQSQALDEAVAPLVKLNGFGADVTKWVTDCQTAVPKVTHPSVVIFVKEDTPDQVKAALSGKGNHVVTDPDAGDPDTPVIP
jgi:hypothetical protein